MNNRLKIVRKKTGLNQNDFADALGISVSNISSYESGRRNPSDAFISSFDVFFIKIPAAMAAIPAITRIIITAINVFSLFFRFIFMHFFYILNHICNTVSIIS